MIKMVVTDMDGTFLSGHNSYDEARFDLVFEELKKRQIRFVVASGNNMKRLSDLFPNHADQITFIAENGAQLIDKGQSLSTDFMEKAEQKALFDFLQKTFPSEKHFLSGEKGGYLLDNIPKEEQKHLAQFFMNLKVVSNFDHLDQEDFFRITLQFDEDFEDKFSLLETYLEGSSLRVVGTGFNCLDILPKSVHKASGLEFLMSQWQIAPSEIMAFGDSPNDLEMLSLVDHSYAMANASDSVKAVANYQAPANTEEGVLQILEEYLKGDLHV